MDSVKYYYVISEEEKDDIVRDELNYIIDKCCINKNKRCKDCDITHHDIFFYFDTEIIIRDRREITYEYTFNTCLITGNCNRFYYPHKFRITNFDIVTYIHPNNTFTHVPNLALESRHLIEYNYITREKKYNV